jgi:hypothetical protein
VSSCSFFVADGDDDCDDNDVGNDDVVFEEEVEGVVDDDSGDCVSAGFEWALSSWWRPEMLPVGSCRVEDDPAI